MTPAKLVIGWAICLGIWELATAARRARGDWREPALLAVGRDLAWGMLLACAAAVCLWRPR